MRGRTIFLLILVILISNFTYAATLHGAVYDASLDLMKNVQLEINTTPKQNYISKTGLYFFNVPPGHYNVLAERYYKGELVFSKDTFIEIKNDGEYNIDIILNKLVDIEMPPEEGEEVQLQLSLFQRVKYGLGIWFYVLVGLMGLLGLIGLSFGAVWLVKRIKKGQNVYSHNVSMNNDEGSSHFFNIGLGNKESADKGKETEEDNQKDDLGIKKSDNENSKNDQNESENDSLYSTDQIINIMKEDGGRTTQKDIRKKIPLSEAKVSLMISELEAKGKIEKIKKGRGNILVLKEDKSNE